MVGGRVQHSALPWRRWGAQLAALVVLLVACLGTGAIGAAFTAVSVGDWYATLRLPAWTPPNWLFGPVWTALYLAMAMAAWWAWRSAGWIASRQALAWFGVQLILNAAWSGFFFTLRSPGGALGVIVLLWWAIAATIRSFARLSTVAALLLVPYLLWVTYAMALNAAIWRLNS